MSGNPNDYSRYLSRSGGSNPPTPSLNFTYGSGGSHIPDTTQPEIPGSSAPPIVDDVSVEQLLNIPGHDQLPRLDPNRPPGTLWFDDDCCVAAQIRSIFERDFKEPHANWRQTPAYVVTRWFNSFAQCYHWDVSITALVRSEFETKLKERMRDQVGRWKKKWMKTGDNAKPRWMEQHVWDGLVQYWMDPKTEQRSTNSRAARFSDPDGYGPHKHRSGQTSFKARARQIAEKTGDSTPDLLAVLEETKRKPDGTFVDGKAEKLYNDVTSKLQELTQQSSEDPQSQGSFTATPVIKNKIYTEVAPRKKGRVYGVGSLQAKIDGSSSGSFSSQSDNATLQAIIDTQATKIAAQDEKLAATEEKLQNVINYLATKDPELANILQGTTPAGPRSDAASGQGSDSGR